MQKFFQEIMDVAEETSTPPEQQYTDVAGAQYGGTQYDFQADTNDFSSIDQNLEIPAPYTSTKMDGHNVNAGNPMAVPVQNGRNHTMNVHATSVDSSTSLHNPSAQPAPSLNPSSKRKSPEGSTEVVSMGGDSKRKRSKISRACDQCRKKKIRCDADSEDNGQLRTCSNCQKAGQICEYSRVPQKRGPSKGYIKELSERVQQVEGQLALQHTTGYRSSFDGQPGPFGEQSFSPADEDAAARRQSSFSQQKSPFAEFNRDRFPSIGGWNNHSHTSAPRNSSIAIPPDQYTAVQDGSAPSTVTRPFWTEWMKSPPKGRTTSVVVSEISEIEETSFQHYYEIIHPRCPVLPESTSGELLNILASATQEYKNAFLGVMRLLPRSKGLGIAGSQTHNPDQYTSDSARNKIEKFVNDNARTRVVHRSNFDSLVLLWIEIILQIVNQHDVRSWSNSVLISGDLVRMSLDLCQDYLMTRTFVPDPPDAQHEAHWLQALHIAAMLGRLYAISKGEVNDPVPASISQYLNVDTRAVPPQVAFVVFMTDTLQASLSLIPSHDTKIPKGTLVEFSRLQNASIKAWVGATGLSMDDPVVTEIKAFSDLLSLRCSVHFAQPQLVGPAANLAEAIRISSLSDSDAANRRYLFNPLCLQTFTLATITLLELLQCQFDDEGSGPLVDEGLEDMKKCLASLVENWSQLDSGEGLFWPSVLAEMIQERTEAKAGDRPAGEEKQEGKVIVDLALLLKRGYVSAVEDFVASR